ncbi:MAG TPA: amidohydrolase family protein [Vicinamibacterales bacterium]|jgi:imidazolonepropionase-like amidohydrolase
MKCRIASLLILAMVTISSTRAADPVVAFVNVNVVPMDRDRVVAGQTVVVRDGRIAAVGPAASTTVPAGAVRVDGQGKYLMPGLAEMHGHVPPPNQPAQYIEDVLFLYFANGVTTVRGMQGAPGQLELRDRVNKGELVGPTLYLAGPSFNGNAVKTPEQAVQMVREQKSQGWDLLKVQGGLSVATYDAMARTAKEVGIPFAGHVPADVGLLHAIEMGQQTYDHIDGFIEYLGGAKGPVDEVKLREIVRRVREQGAWIVPTMAVWETLQGTLDDKTLTAYPELKYMPVQQVQQWTLALQKRLSNPQFNQAAAKLVIDNRMRILRALHEGGVRILLGTDAPQQFSVPGFSIHREMTRMIAAGMTPYDVVKSGTQSVGAYFKDRDDFGTIEVGKRADLVLVDANPLQNVANIARRSGVMARGRWLTEKDIQARLDRIASANKASDTR